MRYKGVAIGVFLFATAIFGTIGTLVIGAIINDFHISSQERKGWLLAANTAIPCLISAFLFYMASIHYEEHRRQLEAEKEDAQTKASNYNFKSDNGSVLGYGQFKQKQEGGVDY